jgi:XTP/dITP diphosphohydrolase
MELSDFQRMVLASRNAGKLGELQRMLGPEWPIVLLPDGQTYAENALLKAASAARYTGQPALADDSGIEVDACAGHPGIRSARWAPPEVQNGILLERLRGLPDEARGATMRAVVAVALPDGRFALAEGVMRGRIADAARGQNGFGYDPIFVLPDGRTTAELEDAAKDAISHRGRAVRALLPALRRLVGSPPHDRREGAEELPGASV